MGPNPIGPEFDISLTFDLIIESSKKKKGDPKSTFWQCLSYRKKCKLFRPFDGKSEKNHFWMPPRK